MFPFIILFLSDNLILQDVCAVTKNIFVVKMTNCSTFSTDMVQSLKCKLIFVQNHLKIFPLNQILPLLPKIEISSNGQNIDMPYLNRLKSELLFYNEFNEIHV
jgi:hypothetical protein